MSLSEEWNEIKTVAWATVQVIMVLAIAVAFSISLVKVALMEPPSQQCPPSTVGVSIDFQGTKIRVVCLSGDVTIDSQTKGRPQ